MHPCARIVHVEPESPADDAGFYPGCSLTAVDGHPLRDIIDWRWLSACDQMTVSYIDGEGDAGNVELIRNEGESWGFEFEGIIFDQIIQCRNACTFCFVRQLPPNVRDTLLVRDDDYRLSFLTGTFATFTNMRPEDEQRVVEQHLSPLRFSLHCITPELRRKVIGKHAAHGVEVAERLMDAGIRLHVQIVLMPNVNDGAELIRTLEWCYEHPNIETVGIVPLGFTRHQSTFTESFNDPERAREVISCIEPFQKRAIEHRGVAWVHASDEFYRNAYGFDLLNKLPPASFYGDYELFEDGIGIVRSFVDDWMQNPDAMRECAEALESENTHVLLVNGCAMREALNPLLSASPLNGRLLPLFVKNRYYGGNVDVTGLLCGCDIGPAVAAEARRLANAGTPARFAVIPRIAFNDHMMTLDDMSLKQLRSICGLDLHVVSCEASVYFRQVTDLLRR